MTPISPYQDLLANLELSPKKWLVTGVAGFIGSHLLETLLSANQAVIGLDNFSTGHSHNLDSVKSKVGAEQWAQFVFIEGDIRDYDTCLNSSRDADYVLHQAALGSVPRSIEDPLRTHESNINGFLNMLMASRESNVQRFVYAASSSTYGDHPGLPKVEDVIGKPLSPYAVTKYVNELYSDVFARCYGFESIGLRYFNVFGPRQDPDGAYAAVIPKWFGAMLRNETISINGDGDTSRDFCFVANAVQANLLAATTNNPDAINQVYNVAVGDRTTLNNLFHMIYDRVVRIKPEIGSIVPDYRDFRPGDVRHSLADISKISTKLGYRPSHRVDEGLDEATAWYVSQFSS